MVNSFNNNNDKRTRITRGNPAVIDRRQFLQFLMQRINEKTAGDRLRYSKQFVSVLTNGDAQPLLQLKPDKRIHAMKAIGSLPCFLGSYDV